MMAAPIPDQRAVAAPGRGRRGTLADVADALPSLYSPASAAANGAKLRKAAALLGAPLALLPGDPHHLETLLRGADRAGAFRAPTPKAEQRAFEDLVRRVVGLCARVAREDASAQPHDAGPCAWEEIEAYVRSRERAANNAPGFAQFSGHSIANLRRLLGDVPPTALSRDVVEARLAGMTGRRLSRLRRSLAFFDRLVAHREIHPEIAAHLPSAPVGTVLRKRAAPLDWFRFPPALRHDVEAAIAAVARPPASVRDDALDALGEGLDPAEVLAQARCGRAVRNIAVAEKGAGVALRWLVREVDAAGILAPAEMTSLATLCRYQIVAAVADHWKAKCAASGFTKDSDQTATLHHYLSRLEVVARRALGDPVEAARIGVLRLTDLTIANPYTREMAKGRADFVSYLRSTPEAVEALIEAPFALAAEAERSLTRWDDLDRTARMQALRLMIGAVWLGLQMCRPVRTGDLSAYTCAGSDPNILGPKSARGLAVLRLRARKNGRWLPTDMPNDVWRIVSLWIERWRPRWIETMQFADRGHLVPGGCASGTLSAQGVSNIWADAVGMVGLPQMTPHMARHAWATVYLAANPGDHETVASLLGDTVATVRAHYGHDDGHEAAARLRRLLEARHPGLFRKIR